MACKRRPRGIIWAALPHLQALRQRQTPDAEWHLRIPDPVLATAILDRIVHSAYRLQPEGESQQKLSANRGMPHT
ncbi:MAG: ATP-binding protein [Anaerolineales bacterium]|nr:ATP-binding protein [Anaerolineales bacterium]